MNSAIFFIIEHIDQEADEEVKWKPEAPKVWDMFSPHPPAYLDALHAEDQFLRKNIISWN